MSVKDISPTIVGRLAARHRDRQIECRLLGTWITPDCTEFGYLAVATAVSMAATFAPRAVPSVAALLKGLVDCSE